MTASSMLNRSLQSMSSSLHPREHLHLTLSDNDDELNERLVQDLLKRLDGPVRLPLSAHERALLITVVEGTHEVSSRAKVPERSLTCRSSNSAEPWTCAVYVI